MKYCIPVIISFQSILLNTASVSSNIFFNQIIDTTMKTHAVTQKSRNYGIITIQELAQLLI